MSDQLHIDIEAEDKEPTEECDYLDCNKESEILSHRYIGPFHIRSTWCKKHHEEFNNFLKGIQEPK